MQVEARITTVSLASLGRDEMRDCVRLWRSVWPKEGRDLEADVDEKLRYAREDSPLHRAEQIHLLRNGHRVLAQARSFIRSIRTSRGVSDILALAGVCSDPALRGTGLGRTVVAAAFERLGPDLPVSLFQTKVPGFYEKLGSRRVANPIVNSTGDGTTFWDPIVMIHPAETDWPEGEIDLLGPGW